ncbi:DUF1552 domain-containing protein [Aporhodopirellula rubra]|uniref:DUF1552 domain-containing protein n=1 Tax=Aporhodopirellula rubra TaxID=980271 RepID=UPI0016230105|nr:DUF1552 domain-containing protein [Aporhodopirellula rubra]
MVCLCNNLGLHASFFVPEGEGRGYKASRYTKVIDDLRDQFTVFSGVSHPEVDGAHSAEKSFLTTAPHSSPSFWSIRNNTWPARACRMCFRTSLPKLSMIVAAKSANHWRTIVD